MSKPHETDWVLVYLAEGRLDGEMIKGFLEAQGIPTVISQESLGSIYGLTVGDLGRAEILVKATDEEKARDLLAAMERGEFSNEILVSQGAEESADTTSENQPDKRKRVLFLCIGNSARSQMAEAIANYYRSDRWVAFSAGTNPSGFVHPLAIRVLQEHGIIHEGSSKPAELFEDQLFDLVVTLCDEAREACPTWFQISKQVHIGIQDPAAAEGSESEKLAAFQKCFDQIQEQILSVLDQNS